MGMTTRPQANAKARARKAAARGEPARGEPAQIDNEKELK